MIGNEYSQDDYILKSEANFHARKHITYMFKSFLELLEALQKEHNINFDKLDKGLPSNYHNIIDMADYFDQAKFSYLRKKILDRGGETIRNLEKDLEII